MKITQKVLILAVIASLSFGQGIQAKYREMAREGYESFKEKTRKTKAQAEQAWQNVDKEALKKGAIAAGSIAAGTAAAAGAGYAAYSATQTGDPATQISDTTRTSSVYIGDQGNIDEKREAFLEILRREENQQ